MGKSTSYLLVIALFLFVCRCSCSSQSRGRDLERCKIRDFGEAADFIHTPNIDDNRMVVVQGIADPRALVWRDRRDGFNYYITRIMGTEQKLFVLKRIDSAKKPGILSEFRGYLLRWDKLPRERGLPIQKALAEQYDIHIDNKKTYVIDINGKPDFCP